jgi:hypothetical protein
MQCECRRMSRPVCARGIPRFVYIRSKQCGTKMPGLRAVEPRFESQNTCASQTDHPCLREQPTYGASARDTPRAQGEPKAFRRRYHADRLIP